MEMLCSKKAFNCVTHAVSFALSNNESEQQKIKQQKVFLSHISKPNPNTFDSMLTPFKAQ